MKANKVSLLCLSIFFLFPFLAEISNHEQITKSQKSELQDKELKLLLSKLIYIEGDSFIMGRIEAPELRMTDADSTLLAGIVPKRVIVDPFFINATEVTNGEWRKFYKDKVAEFGKVAAKRKFYPDTSLWIKEFPYVYNEPMAKNYFSKPNFNNHPVVGITWEQANAYCKWKSKKLQSLLEKSGIKSAVKFRLPTEAEWELASMELQKGKYSIKENQQLVRMNRMPQMYDSYNIGQVHDINNVVLKQYADDGCLYTCEVATYPSNYNGVYNMQGNVAEWTSDPGYATVWDFKNEGFLKLESLSEINEQIEIIKGQVKAEKPELAYQLDCLMHNKKVFTTDNVKICKGGSWADGLVYSLPGCRQAVGKAKASTKIGFRIAISNLEEELTKYLPKKNWEPERLEKRGK